MTQKEFNFIKDAFSQIIDDIAGNPDWHDASLALTADIRELERQLKGMVSRTLPSNLDKSVKQIEFPFDVPNNDGYLVFTPMSNETIRKEFKLKGDEGVIISIRKEK